MRQKVVLPQPKPAAKKSPSITSGDLVELEGRLPEILHYAETKAALGREARLAHYQSEKEEFLAALKKWPDPYRTQLSEMLEASRFIDWAHAAPDIMETFRSRGRLSVLEREIQFLYNSTSSSRAPEFRNIQAVNRFLKECKISPSLERLLKVHTLAMAKGVEGMTPRSLGVVRDYSVIGDESDPGITATVLKRIQANPYLTFEETGRSSTRKDKEPRFYGNLLYPDPFTVKREALERIKSSHPAVFKAVEEFRSQSVEAQKRAHEHGSGQYTQLTRKLITALAEERYSDMARKTKELGDLTTPKAVLDYIKLVALHYRDLISIHVVGNGNGRSLRHESLYDPLDKVGISRPRLNNPDTDLHYSPSGWVREVQRGILNTDALFRDITKRLNLGLRIENSAELVFPNVLRDMKLDLRYRGKKRAEKNHAFQKIDAGQFAAYVDTRFLMESGLLRAFNRDPVATIQILRDEYKQFAKKTRVFCHVPHRGIEQIGLSLIDFDLRSTFGVAVSHNKELWDFKKATWYGDNLIWRGLCFTDQEISCAEALSIFKKPHAITVCNNLARELGSSERTFRRAQQKEFDRYNRDLLTGELKKLVLDHVGEGALYDTSYGASTSKVWGFAAGFAWGRGTFGYENAKVEKAQKQIKSRVVVGALQGHKEVYVGRFKILEESFSYKFGRQQEILAVGGIDPDVVMVVQLLDPKRKIERSFIRNPERPAEVWEVKGGVHPQSVPLHKIPKREIIAIHHLL